MKKSLLKLAAVGLLLAVTLIVMVASSYAWFSVSGNPSVGGLQLNVGGSNTIQIAADVTTVTEEGTLHYPGVFSDSLNLSEEEAYAFLRDMVTLTPVSTADGIHWFFPTYYDSAEGDNAGLQGSIRDISDFLMDDTLSFANLDELPADDSIHGSYAMLDFWVVSPGNCRLRVSVGEGSGGSYMVSTPKPVSDGNGSYKLEMTDESLAACVRVGFLANTQTLTDHFMNAYVGSSAYNTLYRSLKGVYQERGERWNSYPAQFTIFEPNADHHSTENAYTLTENGLNYRTCPNGSYVQTWPIGYVNGRAQLVDVMAQTTIQTRTSWLAATASESMIEQIFKTYLVGVTSPRVETLYDGFYRDYLGYQCGTYLKKGAFIKSTGNLVKALNNDGVVEAETFEALTTAGATDDVVVVELEKNVPQRIRMFVWIEGQDVDCTNVLSDSGLLLNLELAGGNS